MRKKLFTLMTLLLTAVTGAWAFDDSYVADARNAAEVTSENSYTGTVFSLAKEGAWTITKDKSTATASDDAELTFDYGCLPSGSTSASACYTLTALQGISSLKIYYTVSDSKFSEKDQSKSGNLMYQIGTDEAVTSSATDNKSNKTAYLETISDISKDDVIKIYSSSNRLVIFAIYATAVPAKTIDEENLTGVKVNGSALTVNAATEGYSLSGTTITLSDDIEYLTTPDDITLTNHIIYTDATSEDDDVAVAFDGSVTAGYYIGTATIGATKYTVRAKKNTTPTLTAAPTSITVTSAKAGTGTATITLTGANLDGATSVAFASAIEGLTVSPTTFTVDEGAVSQEFTVSYKSDDDVAEAVVNLTFAVGSTNVDVPVTYSSTAAVSEITSISSSTTWDWNDLSPKSEIEYNPILSELILANEASLDYSSFGDATAIKFLNIQRSMQNGAGDHWCAQAHGFGIKNTLPGVLSVEFGGTNKNERQLKVDGEVKGSISASNATKTAVAYIAAGTHNIMGYDVSSSTNNNLRYYVIKFEPLEDADAVTVSSAGYATVVLTKDAYFEATPEVTAYAAKAAGTKVTLTEVKAAPAGTPLVIKAAAGSYTLKKASTISPAAVSTDINDLMAGPVDDSDGTNYYVLGKEGSKVGFGLLASGVNLDATKAYIAASKFAGGDAPGFITIEGADDDSDITTGISAIEHSTLNIEHSEVYNLNGQRVSQPTKGLYIVNGKKVVVK